MTKMYFLTTDKVVESAARELRPAVEHMAPAARNGYRLLAGISGPQYASRAGIPLAIRNGNALEAVDFAVNRFSKAAFTVTMPDDVIWTSVRSEIVSWLAEEWERLGLTGEPLSQYRLASAWLRRSLREPTYRSVGSGFPQLVELADRGRYGGYRGAHVVRHVLALPRKDF